jgi:hypothetical protein
MSSNKSGQLSRQEGELRYTSILYPLRSSRGYPWKSSYREKMLSLVEFLASRIQK